MRNLSLFLSPGIGVFFMGACLQTSHASDWKIGEATKTGIYQEAIELKIQSRASDYPQCELNQKKECKNRIFNYADAESSIFAQSDLLKSSAIQIDFSALLELLKKPEAANLNQYLSSTLISEELILVAKLNSFNTLWDEIEKEIKQYVQQGYQFFPTRLFKEVWENLKKTHSLWRPIAFSPQLNEMVWKQLFELSKIRNKSEANFRSIQNALSLLALNDPMDCSQWALRPLYWKEKFVNLIESLKQDPKFSSDLLAGLVQENLQSACGVIKKAPIDLTPLLGRVEKPNEKSPQPKDPDSISAVPLTEFQKMTLTRLSQAVLEALRWAYYDLNFSFIPGLEWVRIHHAFLDLPLELSDSTTDLFSNKNQHILFNPKLWSSLNSDQRILSMLAAYMNALEVGGRVGEPVVPSIHKPNFHEILNAMRERDKFQKVLSEFDRPELLSQSRDGASAQSDFSEIASQLASRLTKNAILLRQPLRNGINRWYDRRQEIIEKISKVKEGVSVTFNLGVAEIIINADSLVLYRAQYGDLATKKSLRFKLTQDSWNAMTQIEREITTLAYLLWVIGENPEQPGQPFGLMANEILDSLRAEEKNGS